MRLAELQQAAVFAQFGDERQEAEQQPVGSSLLLLLLDLKKAHERVETLPLPQVSRSRPEMV